MSDIYYVRIIKACDESGRALLANDKVTSFQLTREELELFMSELKCGILSDEGVDKDHIPTTQFKFGMSPNHKKCWCIVHVGVNSEYVEPTPESVKKKDYQPSFKPRVTRVERTPVHNHREERWVTRDGLVITNRAEYEAYLSSMKR